MEEKRHPNMLQSSREKPKSFTLGANFANIEFEVYEDDDEEVIQSNSVGLPSFDALDSLDTDPNKDILLPDSMKIEIEDPEFINCDDEQPPKKKFAYTTMPKQENCGRSCAYIDCKNNTRKNPKLTLYPFPNKQSKLFVKQYYEWIQNSGLYGSDDDSIKQKFICEDHFEPSAFINPKVKGRLKASAVPRPYKAGLPAPSVPATTPIKAPSAPITLPLAIAPKITSTPTPLSVVSVLTDPSCAVCKDKLSVKVNYVKVPDSPHVRSLWEITTEMSLTPYDLVCEKHFLTLDVPTNQVSKSNNTGTVNIYNHRPTCLPCLTPIEGCCVRNCPNAGNDALTLFTFDLRQADKWLNRLGDPSLFNKTKKELLRVRVCATHFNPLVLRKYKFFETELVPTRNLPDGKVYPEDPNLESLAGNQSGGQLVLAPVTLLSSPATNSGAKMVPIQLVSTGGGVTCSPAGTFNVPTVVGKPPKIEKIVVNRLQCLYKNCPRMANTSYKFFKPPTSLERAKKWLKTCDRKDILRLPDNDLEDFITKAEGICEVHVGSVYREKNESTINRMICGYKSCQSTYSTGSKVFKFPINPDLRTKWFEAAGIKTEPKPKEMEFFTKSIGICISHFLDSDFNDDRDLRPDAIPQSVDDTEKDKTNKVDGVKHQNDWTDFANPLEARNKTGIFNCCVVPTCTNDIKDSIIPFHYFPSSKRDQLRYNLWVEMIREPQIKNIPPNIVIKMYRICSEHFENFFFVDPDKKMLKNTAVPTIGVPGSTVRITAHPFYYQKLKKFLKDNKITNFIPESMDAAQPIVDLDGKQVTVPVMPSRPQVPPRLMQWIPYNPESEEKDEIKTKCIIEQTGLSFPNLGKKLCLAKPEEANSKLPFDVFKFDVSTMTATEELQPGHKLQIHTAIIIDDDDTCEQQAMVQIFKLLRKQHEKMSENVENDVENEF